MKGFRSFVLQDLPYVLPPKGLQSQLLSNCQLASSHIHTSSTSRRFWNLFEFAAKEEISRDNSNCPCSKDIATSSMITTPDHEGASKNVSSNATYTSAVPFGSKNNAYLFDLKSTPMSCMKISQPLQQDNLMSLLDGNPVPKTLKWKLKGYRTLRNERDGDFAFIPGAKSNDCDIISRNESAGPINAVNPIGEVVARNEQSESETVATVDETDTLCLSNEIVEHKEELPENTENTVKAETVEMKVTANDIPDQEPPNNCNSSIEDLKLPVVCSGQKVPTLPKLLAGSIPMKEDIKFLPICKSELSSTQLKYQTQPAAQYSSRPPKRFSKPSAPVLKQTTGTKPPPSVKKFTPSMESYQENQASESKQAQAPPEALAPKQTEAAEEVTREWSSMETQDSNRYTKRQQYQDRDQNVPQLSTNPNPVEQDVPLPLSEPLDKPYIEEPPDMEPRQTVENENRVNRRKQYDQREPDSYFAPRSNKYSGRSTRSAGENVSSRENRSSYESLVGLPPRAHPILNISYPGKDRQTIKASPCAASHARLQQGTGSEAAGKNQAGSSGGNGSAMSSGQSGNRSGGPKKPPGSLPPFAVRRSSSNSCCLLKKITVPRDIEDAPRRGVNSVNPSSNISTSSVDSARRKCEDDDSDKCKNRGRKCKPQRPKCEEERPKCKKEKKPCKRYCCPALQTLRECDYGKFQCPSDCPIPPIKTEADPTCMPDKGKKSRDICTAPSRKKKPQRSCKRERSCGQEREQSCGREERSCQRRSCKKQEPVCPEPQGREICTKPRKRENQCKRERKCGDRGKNKRSAKCSGRRHYTQLAHTSRSKSLRNVKCFSSLPAFAFPFISARTGMESKQRLQETTSEYGRFYGKKAKPPTCKDSKTDNKCNKESKKDPCKAVTESCKKEENPCKKVSQTSCGEQKKDYCGKQKSKSEDFCAKRREELCKDRKKATSKSSDSESTKDRVQRELKEMEECKKGSKDKKDKGKKKSATGLERVVSPCKQKQSNDKGSKCKFTALDIPYNCFTNTMSTTAMRQDGYKYMLPNFSTDRSYSTTIERDSDVEVDTEPHANANLYSFHDDSFNIDEMTIPNSVEDHDEMAYDHGNYSSNWLLSWFNGHED